MVPVDSKHIITPLSVYEFQSLFFWMVPVDIHIKDKHKLVFVVSILVLLDGSRRSIVELYKTDNDFVSILVLLDGSRR